MSERNITFLLEDIIESINNIQTFTDSLRFEEYTSDIKTIHAVQHNFMIIGEAVARIPQNFKLSHNHIDWKLIKDFRNIIVHEYFGIDQQIVWEIIQIDLKDLKNQIEEVVRSI